MKNILFVIGLLSINCVAFAQTAKRALANTTYKLLVVDNIAKDGSRIHLYGPDPQGLLMFDNGGRYMMEIYNNARPKFAANDKSKGTDQENREAIQGSNAHFGQYEIDDSLHIITFLIKNASYPNWEGTARKSPYMIHGDTLKYVVQSPTTGTGVTGEVVWLRVH